LGLAGLEIDAEIEYKKPGKESAARIYMSELRASLPDIPITLCSYRYPYYHLELPWKAFLEKCDFHMPQVYWEQSHNPGYQLTRSLNEFRKLEQELDLPQLPYIPVGAAYRQANWWPTVADVDEFDAKAKELGLQGLAWYRWGHAVEYELDSAIAEHEWDGTIPPPPPPPLSWDESITEWARTKGYDGPDPE